VEGVNREEIPMRGRALPSRPLLAFALVLLGLTAPGAGASRVVLSTPGRILVELTRGDALVVPVAVTVPALDAEPLDFFLIEDASSNFASGLLSFEGEVDALGPQLQADHPGAEVGLGSFVDKPVSPFGSAATDYDYATNLPLSPLPSDLLSAAARLTSRWGRDVPGSQLDVLLQVGLRAFGEVGFRPTARRVAVLSTGGAPHFDVDALRLGFPPNNGDAVLDGTPPGTGEAYPSVDQVRGALLAAGVVPLFAVSGTSLATYQSLVTQLGFGSAVALGKNGTNVRGTIETGLGAMLYGIEPSVEDDVRGYATAVAPTAQLGVAAGETRTFELTLLWPQTGDDPVPPAGETLWVRTPYGDTRIDVDLDSGLPPCSDGIDNDGDGRIDFDGGASADGGVPLAPPDRGCKDATSPTENPACQDGFDNDGDGGIDFDGGAAANGGIPLGPPDVNCIGDPSRDYETLTPNCGLGAELAPVVALLTWLRERRRRHHA
jgi:hypothetical protein